MKYRRTGEPTSFVLLFSCLKISEVEVVSFGGGDVESAHA